MKNTVFEKYQVRKSKKQKTRFIDFVKSHSQQNGYECIAEKGAFGGKNIVVGNPENAKVVFTAHYDTCPKLPFPNFITPKNIGIYILYNIALVVGIMAFLFALGFATGAVTALVGEIAGIDDKTMYSAALVVNYALYFGLLGLLLFGPANKNTANDNTSGVMTLLTLMQKMPSELREKCAFVFFDLEEVGLIGSMGFAARHKNVKKNTLVINFDCVSDGDNFIFTVPKKARDTADLLADAYASDAFNVEVLTKGYFYPSDQANFKKSIGVAALKKSKRLGVLYMDRIHTKKDTVYQSENIDYLVDSSIKLTQLI